jgi:5'-phosphate synthase pdxT subunit
LPTGSRMKIGVLACQGAFAEHIRLLRQIDVAAFPIRLPHEFDGLDGLIIPGGESTAIIRLIREYDLISPLSRLLDHGFPVMGTCAGMILLAKHVLEDDTPTLGLMDITVRRNAFGRQVDSFEANLDIPALGNEPYPAVFIRAPYIEAAGTGVDVLATLADGTIVAVRQGNLLATAFHPELTDDLRFHRYFLDMVRDGERTTEEKVTCSER